MGQSDIIYIGQQAIYTALIVAAPILGLGLLVGIVVSVFQAATQINEQALVFIPKILAVAIAFVIFGPWMLKKIIDFTDRLFVSINSMVG
ncbi:MAG TPA: flagellar biosynthesis protein FliQ [Clostridia bacterium]|nr:flagellar biosynthesis protein FliQ [Clostridia bacterium]